MKIDIWSVLLVSLIGVAILILIFKNFIKIELSVEAINLLATILLGIVTIFFSIASINFAKTQNDFLKNQEILDNEVKKIILSETVEGISLFLGYELSTYNNNIEPSIFSVQMRTEMWDKIQISSLIGFDPTTVSILSDYHYQVKSLQEMRVRHAAQVPLPLPEQNKQIIQEQIQSYRNFGSILFCVGKQISELKELNVYNFDEKTKTRIKFIKSFYLLDDKEHQMKFPWLDTNCSSVL